MNKDTGMGLLRPVAWEIKSADDRGFYMAGKNWRFASFIPVGEYKGRLDCRPQGELVDFTFKVNAEVNDSMDVEC